MNFISSFIYRRIGHRPNLVKIVNNIGWLFFDKIIRMGLGFFIGVWIVRYLGPEQFGLLSFATAFAGIFSAFATLGLPSIVVRDLVRNPDYSPETLGTTAILYLVGGTAVYFLILVAIAYLRPDDADARTIVAILGSMVLLKGSEISVYWFESKVLSKYIVWVQNGVFLVFAAVKVILILQQTSLIAFVWIMLAETLVVSIILLLVMNKHGILLAKLRVSAERAKSLLKDSWPLLFSSMVLMVQARIDQVMLGQMIGEIEVGYYSLALIIIEFASFTTIILHSSFAPSIILSKKISEKVYLDRLEGYYKLNFAIALFIAVPIAIFSPWIILVFFGEAYRPAALIMSIMTIRLIFAHIGVAKGIYFANENLLKFSALTMIIGTVINIALNYLWIPMYQGVGATVASLVSFFMTIFFFDFFYSKTKKNAFLMVRSFFLCFTIFRKKSWVF
jgi:O-antigen/teichoic acid export membrane protein